MKKGYWFILGGIVVCWFASWGLINTFITETNRGAFGDMFGAVNALFSGLALAGVVIAIFMQKEELSLQREELKLTREEMNRQAKAQEESSDALVRQVEMTIDSTYLNAIVVAIKNYDNQLKIVDVDEWDELERKKIYMMESLHKTLSRIMDEYGDKVAMKNLKKELKKGEGTVSTSNRTL